MSRACSGCLDGLQPWPQSPTMSPTSARRAGGCRRRRCQVGAPLATPRHTGRGLCGSGRMGPAAPPAPALLHSPAPCMHVLSVPEHQSIRGRGWRVLVVLFSSSGLLCSPVSMRTQSDLVLMQGTLHMAYLCVLSAPCPKWQRQSVCQLSSCLRQRQGWAHGLAISPAAAGGTCGTRPPLASSGG